MIFRIFGKIELKRVSNAAAKEKCCTPVKSVIFLLRNQVFQCHLPVRFHLRKRVQYFPVYIFIVAQTCYSRGETFSMLFLGSDSTALVDIFEHNVFLGRREFEMVADDGFTVSSRL